MSWLRAVAEERGAWSMRTRTDCMPTQTHHTLSLTGRQSELGLVINDPVRAEEHSVHCHFALVRRWPFA